MKAKFTDRYLKSLKPQDKPKEYTEPQVGYRGTFGIRVSKGGVKSFFVYLMPKNGPKRRRITLGTYPALSLSEARKDAHRKMADAEQGTDIVAEKQEQLTMTDLWTIYKNSKEYTHNKRTRREKTSKSIYEQDRKWNKIVKPAWGDQKVSEITRLDVKALLATLPSTQANRTHSFLNQLFTKAADLGWIELHPMYGLSKPNSEGIRERVLENGEIASLWQALDNEKITSEGRDAMKLIFLTGQRPGEVLSMRFDDIDGDGNWHQSTNKTNTHNVVPLNEQSLIIINWRRNLGDGIDVFYEQRTKSSIKSVKRQRLKANKIMNSKSPWTEHDLRRSARTLMGKLGIAPDIAERVLGHSVTGIQKVYDKYSYLKEKRAALKKLGNEIDRLTGQNLKKKSKVVQMSLFNNG